MRPSFKHDCEKCEFVGKIFRRIGLDPNSKKKSTDVYRSCSTYGSKYILRCSSQGSDYITTDNFEQYMA